MVSRLNSRIFVFSMVFCLFEFSYGCLIRFDFNRLIFRVSCLFECQPDAGNGIYRVQDRFDFFTELFYIASIRCFFMRD